MPRESNRREFLRGQSAVDAVQDLADTLADLPYDIPSPKSDGYLLRIGRRAMACEFEVLLNAGQYEQGTEAALAALDVVDELEQQLSVYRTDSEVSVLNQTAAAEPISVEPRLFSLLRRAAELHAAFGGGYDITSGALTKCWGFYRRAGRLPSDDEIVSALQTVGMRHVLFDTASGTVQFARPGIEINLGSIGKGYALDRAVECLQSHGIDNFLLHGGNSSLLARGSRRQNGVGSRSPQSNSEPSSDIAGSTPDPFSQPAGWSIGLRHPLKPEKRLGEVRLHNRAAGTSGCGTQFFVHQGKRYGHIIDPRTGWPAEGTLSTTVLAETGADADALATAFYVIGAEGASDYCRQHASVGAVILSPHARAGRVLMTVIGIEPADLRIDADESVEVKFSS